MNNKGVSCVGRDSQGGLRYLAMLRRGVRSILRSRFHFLSIWNDFGIRSFSLRCRSWVILVVLAQVTLAWLNVAQADPGYSVDSSALGYDSAPFGSIEAGADDAVANYEV